MADSDKKQKFMFDTHSFDLPSKDELDVPPEPTYTESEVEEMKQASFIYGKSMGVEETRQAQEEVLIALMGHMENLMKDLIAGEDKREEEKNNAIIHLSLKMVQKLFPDLATDNVIDEIQHMVMDVLAERQEEARIVITVHDGILDKLKERIDTMCDNAGFHGKIILMAGKMLKSDCRVEWADGGAERNCEKIFATIEGALSTQLSHKMSVQQTPAVKQDGTQHLEESNNT